MNSLHEMVGRNPSYVGRFCAAMSGAENLIERSKLAGIIETASAGLGCMQTPQSIIDILIKYDALKQIITVNDAIYEGALEDLREDESIPDDATVRYFVELTQAGKDELAIISPSARIASAFENHPSRQSGLLKTLQFCNTDGGRTKSEIEEALNADKEAIPTDPKTNLPKVYPAFYTTVLEDAGALVWDGMWKITSDGKEYLRSLGK